MKTDHTDVLRASRPQVILVRVGPETPFREQSIAFEAAEDSLEAGCVREVVDSPLEGICSGFAHQTPSSTDWSVA